MWNSQPWLWGHRALNWGLGEVASPTPGGLLNLEYEVLTCGSLIIYHPHGKVLLKVKDGTINNCFEPEGINWDRPGKLHLVPDP